MELIDDEGAHKRIRLNSVTLGYAKAEPDFYEAYMEAWERCQLAPDPQNRSVVTEAARDAAEKHGLTGSQQAMLLAYLNAED